MVSIYHVGQDNQQEFRSKEVYRDVGILKIKEVIKYCSHFLRMEELSH